MNVELEYRVRPVTRYIVTRFHDPMANAENAAGIGVVRTCGEYDGKEIAETVAFALCKQEHETKGWPVDDPRIRYPDTRDDRVMMGAQIGGLSRAKEGQDSALNGEKYPWIGEGT